MITKKLCDFSISVFNFPNCSKKEKNISLASNELKNFEPQKLYVRGSNIMDLLIICLSVSNPIIMQNIWQITYITIWKVIWSYYVIQHLYRISKIKNIFSLILVIQPQLTIIFNISQNIAQKITKIQKVRKNE